MSNEAFEKWWEGTTCKIHIPRSPKEYARYLFEAGHQSGVDRAAEVEKVIEAAQKWRDDMFGAIPPIEGHEYADDQYDYKLYKALKALEVEA